MKKRILGLYTLAFVGAVLIFTGCSSSKDYAVNEDDIKKGPSATLVMELKETAIGIGVQKGEGILTYQGQEYPFTLKGFDYGSISRITMQTNGKVFHLDDISEFEGMYFQARAGLTIGEAGKAGHYLINKKGVTIHLSSEREKGFDLAIGRGGIKIKFAKEKE